tara:strand:+ start:486 stop:647 length:162 start_codon:yes stop_codon:yes gene_type:complete
MEDKKEDGMKELLLRIDELEERIDYIKKQRDCDINAIIKTLSELSGEPEWKFR